MRYERRRKNWFYGLRQFIADSHVKRPIVDREVLSAGQEMQCRIIGGSLISWLEKHGPRLLQEPAVFAGIEDWEKDPFIVFTSEQRGLVAAREILEGGPMTEAFLYPREFADLLKRHPDLGYRWHVHTWSFFTPVNAETANKARKYPIGPGESYWLHKEGTMSGALFGRGGDHGGNGTGKPPNSWRSASTSGFHDVPLVKAEDARSAPSRHAYSCHLPFRALVSKTHIGPGSSPMPPGQRV